MCACAQSDDESVPWATSTIGNRRGSFLFLFSETAKILHTWYTTVVPIVFFMPIMPFMPIIPNMPIMPFMPIMPTMPIMHFMPIMPMMPFMPIMPMFL